MAERLLGHAVVVGASMAGLLAARVLTDHADEVTLVDRDVLPEAPEHRRGVPQARHAHVLLPRGLRVLEELLPGFAASLLDDGAVVLDDLAQIHFCALGRTFSAVPYPRPPTLLSTRDLLEHRVRSAVLGHPRIRLCEGTAVTGLLTEARGRVRGVALAGRSPAATLDADLVVDASGRGSRLDEWLTTVGRPASTALEQPVGVRYATQLVRMPADAVPQHLVVVGPRPGRPQGFYLPRYEHGLRMVTVMGYGAASPEPMREDLLSFTGALAPAPVAEAVRRAEPLGPVAGFRYPASRRRRLTAPGVLPEGLVVVGDALCTFNPIYGQGVTVAACEAVALGAALKSGAQRLPRRFQLAAERIADQAWQVSVPVDRSVLALPQSVRARAEQRFLGRLLDRARHDPRTAATVLEVLTMDRTRQSLMRPTHLRQALATGSPAA